MVDETQATDQTAEPAHIEQIGPYRILELLGEGGMGTVYGAEQREPVRRRVALKVIKLGMDTKEVLARFEAERQALALMDHPNIASVLDAGATVDGRPYFAMELVKGIAINSYADKHCLGVKDRLRLLIDVCRGVQHAHQQGVIHRDLKPNNILVQLQDGRPVAKIIDFGIAKATNQALTQKTLWTQEGQIIGTPEYMSPEQAEMSGLGVDTRSDVYSLGVLLYELLTGNPPFIGAELRRAGFLEIQRKLREEEPHKPSTRVTERNADSETAASQRHTDVRGLIRKLRGELDWITMRALEKDPTRRYQSASEFAADLERHVDGHAVEAGPPGAWYRVRKIVTRHKRRFMAAAVVLLALVAGLVVSLIFYFNMREARDAEAIARSDAERNATMTRRALAWWELRHATDTADKLYPAWPFNLRATQRWMIDYTEKIEPMLPQVTAAIAELRGDESRDQLVLDRLVALQAELEEMADDDGLAADMRARAQWSATIENRSITQHSQRWDQAIDGVRASEKYGGYELTPQLGLVPIGMNPKTQLWEFMHLRSASRDAALPGHDPSGATEMKTGTGIIFVLIPGGVARLGAQHEDPDGHRYDRYAHTSEGPVRQVRLDPFFLSKYELSQLQWMQLSNGQNPSFYNPPAAPTKTRADSQARAAVEQVSWNACDRLLRRHGLVLPTEAQWEYACRAGTDTPWWTGEDRASLSGAANLADQTAKLLAKMPAYEDWSDDCVVHGVIAGKFRANGFGLESTLGNVWEWCRDGFSEGEGVSFRPRDGMRMGTGMNTHGDVKIYRGGSYADVANDARCSTRHFNTGNHVSSAVGVRPARKIHGVD